MRKAVCILAGLLFVAGGCESPATFYRSDERDSGSSPNSGSTPYVAVRLRYDGVYRSPLHDPGSNSSYRFYLRFYPDGEVIEGSYEHPENLPKFTREDPDMARGKVTIQGNRISFSTLCREGTISYNGVQLDGDRIRLDIYSHINDNRFSEVFEFAPL